MPTLTIDGQKVESPEGSTVIQAAETLGIFVPRYCYHPGLSIAGNCRICLVDVEKNPKLQIACNTPGAEGQEEEGGRGWPPRDARPGALHPVLALRAVYRRDFRNRGAGDFRPRRSGARGHVSGPAARQRLLGQRRGHLPGRSADREGI